MMAEAGAGPRLSRWRGGLAASLARRLVIKWGFSALSGAYSAFPQPSLPLPPPKAHFLCVCVDPSAERVAKKFVKELNLQHCIVGYCASQVRSCLRVVGVKPRAVCACETKGGVKRRTVCLCVKNDAALRKMHLLVTRFALSQEEFPTFPAQLGCGGLVIFDADGRIAMGKTQSLNEIGLPAFWNADHAIVALCDEDDEEDDAEDAQRRVYRDMNQLRYDVMNGGARPCQVPRDPNAGKEERQKKEEAAKR